MKISVSILDMDFGNLKEAIKTIENTPIDSLHMDIMDGHFVDNISFGPDIVRTVKGVCSVPLHTHLMIYDPEKFVDRFFKAGSRTVTVHAETLNDKNLHILDRNNMGISLNPDMSIERIYPYLAKVKRVLVMSVMAGFGGQEFIETSVESIYKLAEKRKKTGLDFVISVDGGVNSDSAAKCIKAGADELVVGAYITKADNPEERIRQLKIDD